MGLVDRFKNVWNAFSNKDPTEGSFFYANNSWNGTITSSRPDRYHLNYGGDKTIINSIYNKIAMDAADITIEHVRTDENQGYVETIHSGLNNVLNLEANLDQTAFAFKQDMFMSMLDEGCIAAVPVDTTISPKESNSYDILTMRIGKILQWAPDKIKVRLYNERTGKYEEIWLDKSMVAIIENPLYSVMNEPNSTLRRLVHKLSLLDIVDEQNSSGKLDIIIQLPYTIKTSAREQQAENRRKSIENQLAGSKYGIAYADATERITQLNRPAENNLLTQVEYLTKTLYAQLGMTEEVFNGTANEKQMLNYYNRTIEPILNAVCLEFKRKFLTKTARSQYQSIMFFREPFKLVPVDNLADIADKFTRNEIMTSNEFRQVIGLMRSDAPGADELRNKNLYPTEEEMPMGPPMEEEPENPMDQPLYPEGT
jgi:hypothetical protein